MQQDTFLFIYYNGKEIKALGREKAKEKHSEMIENGWKHTATIDTSVWVEYLYNKCEAVDAIDEILSLSKTKN